MAMATCLTVMLPMYSRPSKASARCLSQCSTPTAGHGAGVPNRHVRHTGKVVGGSDAGVHGASCQDIGGDSLAERGHEAQDACVLNRALLGRSWGGSGRREAESYDLLPHRPADGVRRSCLSLKLVTRRVSVHFYDLQYTRTAFP